MNDEKTPVNKRGEESLQPTPLATVALDWRIVIGLVAVLVVGYFAYTSQVFQTIEPTSPVAANPTLEAETTLTAPEATAQANPDSAEAQFELANAYYQAGHLDQAIEVYQKVIILDPNYQAAYANLGVAYYQQRRFDLAASQYEKALELNPDDGDVAYNLGVLYLQQALSQNEQPDPQLLNQAVEQLQTARDISPDLAEPYFSLGVAYLALNQPDQATQAFETYLAQDLELDPRAQQEAERYLQMLKGQ